MDLVLELKNNASKLLLAIMESRGDGENAERILYNMNPKQLVSVQLEKWLYFCIHINVEVYFENNLLMSSLD